MTRIRTVLFAALGSPDRIAQLVITPGRGAASPAGAMLEAGSAPLISVAANAMGSVGWAERLLPTVVAAVADEAPRARTAVNVTAVYVIRTHPFISQV